MEKITRILEKLNQGRSDRQITLADIMPLSLAEVRNKAGSRVSREEAQLLQHAAVKEKQNNISFAARALTRANPLLRKEMGAARHHGAAPYGFNDIIMPRADEFAAPGAVSSMFSPAGYLTELYREARGLHQKGSVNYLDQRRPDLATLVLSQENLDKEVSTLALANDQLESALMAKAGQTDKTKYYGTLASSRNSGVTPYNTPFECVREALIQQDFSLPDSILSKGAESAAQLALAAGISPELYAILTEKTDGLSESETEALLKKNFPYVNTDSLMNLDALTNYYELPRDEIQALPESEFTGKSKIKTEIVTRLLTLNKTLRLAKACGLTPLETRRALTRLRFSKDETDATVLHRICEALHYRKRYCIDTETALMLCNADISQVNYDGQLSQFDRLFNNPPLNGVTYTLGGNGIPMKPDAEDPRRDVLKRAFRVDNTGLWQIFDITDRNDGDKIDTNNIENLSDLLLVRLLADVHNLAVTQLDALLRVSPYRSTNIYRITDQKRRELMTFLYQTTQWLNAQNMTVEQLVMLLTTDAPAAPTKEMNALLDALRNGGIDSTDENTLCTTMAPVIAGAMKMENPEQAEALLHWMNNDYSNQLLPIGVIWVMITTEKPSAEQQKHIAIWCQTLAQRVLVIRTFALSDTELQILSQSAHAYTVSALREISDFHNLINRCGEHAGTVLDALQSSTLTVTILAKALNLSEYVITQALTQAGQKPELTTWQPLATLPARLDLADTLRITPKDITNLLTVSESTEPSYADLSTLSGLLQAGLNEQQTAQLKNQSEQRRSEALSGEYRSLIMSKPLANRDDIWRQLLIDGKVSAAITTTRLADAIAGIQLYINRTLAGDEPDADSALLERQFFKDWDTYNKRYSTWAGVSQLVYYPENTIDPTIRIGQTGMMNTMLEQLSQSELNSDTLENGFRQYLTAFEQVANLNVVSGYHDAVDIDQGNTWFIGTSQTEPKKYYWRKADHSKFQNGRFAANAWSDWKEITCAVNPYQDMIRPVIYRSRLYLLWIEEQIQKDKDSEKGIPAYSLKLTHINYDGSWASPFSYDVTKSFKDTTSGGYGKGLLCTENNEDETLTVVCYTKQSQYNFTDKEIEIEIEIDEDTIPPTKDNTFFGLQITTNMAVSPAPVENTRELLHTATNQLDRPDLLNIVSKIVGKFISTITPQEQTDNKQVTIELAESRNKLISSGEDKYLELAAKINCIITPDKIPVPLRRDFCSQFRTYYNVDSYYPEVIRYNSKKPLFPEGSCTLHMANVSHTASSTGTVYFLQIPAGGDISSVRDNLDFLSETSEGPDFLGKLIWRNSDENYHYFFMYYEYTIKQDSTIRFIIRNSVDKTLYATIETDKWKPYIDSSFYPDHLTLSFFHDNTEISVLEKPTNLIKLSDISDTITVNYLVQVQRIKIPQYIDEDKLDLTLKVNYKKPNVSGARNYDLHYEKPVASNHNISLHTTAGGAQYMEWKGYRTRLNTLFARQLIERANRGIDAVLSPETQNLREPKPGVGTYVTLTLKPYDPEIHGSDRKFIIYAYSAYMPQATFVVCSGTLSVDAITTVTFFIPVAEENITKNYGLDISPKYEKPVPEKIRNIILHRIGNNQNNPHGWTLDETHNNGTFPGLAENGISGLSQPDEPMDFSGANALYFWELFYYTPMMVAMRLLQEQNFTEANRWLSYIWQPASTGAGDWRVRPLKEDTSWNADPMDSVDPDAVAQNDPMHYKVSTLMKLLDLLIARGDSAYRMLERDTLNEAKMWYMQALGLLGDKPLTVISSAWGNPELGKAADDTQVKQLHEKISHIRSGGLLPETRTANTLTGLFLPQQNEKLLGYWQTLDMRLFNLRNDLSIEGQPLSLPIFAAPADPAALLSAAAAASGGGKALPNAAVPALRFPQMLESARSLTGQLMQFGATLQGLIERQDAEAMSELLQNQAGALMLSSLRMQEQALAELDAEKKVLVQSRAGAQARFESYRRLYDENISAAEQRTMDLYLSSSVMNTTSDALYMGAAAADMAPNIFGVAVGGSRWGGIPKAIGMGIGLAASSAKITADNISQSEAWRRRRQEWEIQKNSAESDVKQVDAQLDALTVRRTATEMQREHLEVQQAQTQAQLEFLQRKFSNKALYSWLRGRLAAVYYRFYDLTAARCMMAEAAFAWQTGETTRYIKPGAWQSSQAGLMAGESLLLNLTEMEQAWLKWDRRALEVTRTVSLAEVYNGYGTPVNLTDTIATLLAGSGSGSTPEKTGLSMTKDKQLHAAFNLKALKIADDYPFSGAKTRRIKQVSVTLPALVGPYQDVRAVLSYGGDVILPDGCKTIAVSHGMDDSGQFRLDFNDGRWLPFEGIPVDNDNSLTLSFPGATGEKQKALLLSLSDIIVHIRYTIR